MGLAVPSTCYESAWISPKESGRLRTMAPDLAPKRSSLSSGTMLHDARPAAGISVRGVAQQKLQLGVRRSFRGVGGSSILLRTLVDLVDTRHPE